ncbi:hypothetical protein ACJJTC_014158 [Scirpophaga incertulas]
MPIEKTDEGSSHDLMKMSDEVKCCWVCFATEDDDRLAAWVQPCKCIGTTKWVHQNCLQRWIDEKQRGNITRKDIYAPSVLGGIHCSFSVSEGVCGTPGRDGRCNK